MAACRGTAGAAAPAGGTTGAAQGPQAGLAAGAAPTVAQTQTAAAPAVVALSDAQVAADGSVMAPGTFYVTLSHLAPSSSAADMQAFRYGVTKALNSLSTKPTINLLTALDPGKTVYRANLSDYSLSAANWAAITAAPGAAAGIKQVGNAPVVDADWLVYAVTRPEIYDGIMNIPNFVSGGITGLPDLETQLGVDQSQAIYLIAPSSEVTFNTRVLQRVPVNGGGGVPGGYYWRTYDFLSTVDPATEAAGIADPAGLHTKVASTGNLVAGEMFFSLPNGLQGFMLSGFQQQHRIDAQALVATDHNRPQDGLTTCVGGMASCGYVINGESCLTCHASGIKMNPRITDVRNTTLAQAQAIMQQDQTRYTTALASMGFPDVAGEPINQTLAKFRTLRNVTDARQQGSEVNPVINIATIFGR